MLMVSIILFLYSEHKLKKNLAIILEAGRFFFLSLWLLQRLTKIFILKCEGIIEKFSYELRVYESEDDIRKISSTLCYI